MSSKTRVCVPVTEPSVTEALKSAQEYIAKGADILEIRIDALKNPDKQRVKQLFSEIDFPLIATNRIKSEGGQFSGSEKERVDILISACSGADYVDIELQTEANLRSMVIESFEQSIISFHDFEKTPPLDEIMEIVKKEKELGDIAKFAVMPLTMEDTLTVLQVVSQIPQTIGIAMGEMGKYTRVTAPLLGSPITFAYSGAANAPGQLCVETTRFILDELRVKK